MNLYGFNIPTGNKDLEKQIRDIHHIAFPNGESQVESEVLPIMRKLRSYSHSKIKALYAFSACLYYCYITAGNGTISRVDEMYLFSSIRGNFDLPRIDMLILYDFLKEKPEINHHSENKERFRQIFKERMIKAFEIVVQETMNEDFFVMSDIKRRLTLEMVIVNTWKQFTNADFTEILSDANMSVDDLHVILNEVRAETRRKYIKE